MPHHTELLPRARTDGEAVKALIGTQSGLEQAVADSLVPFENRLDQEKTCSLLVDYLPSDKYVFSSQRKSMQYRRKAHHNTNKNIFHNILLIIFSANIILPIEKT